MTVFPEQFTDRWRDRGADADFRDSVCWHLLLGGLPAVEKIAALARQRLGGFKGFHMTPARWLHATVLRAGSVTEFTQPDIDRMLAGAQVSLAAVAPVRVKLGRLLYHQEGIALAMSPRKALLPVFEAAQAITREVTGSGGITSSPEPSWVPHVTLCYSTSDQAAAPIIDALGTELPDCELTIDELSLVIQSGSELSWDWRPVGTARLGR
jgi:2'-5' RNA ligase